MGCEPCLLLDIHVLNHQLKTQLKLLKLLQQKFPGIFQTIQNASVFGELQERDRERDGGHVIQCSELMSAVLERKHISSDESDKKHQDSNLYLEMWLVKWNSTRFLPQRMSSPSGA